MTFRLLGIPDELRLEIEQNGGGTTKAAQLIIENAVQEAQAQTEMALREIQSIVGPHGSLTRIQAGGLRITPGSGMGIFTDGVHKTQIQPNGTFVIGSDIETPATTTEIFFTEDTIYNNEEFVAGDFLIGDNSEGISNLKYNAEEGRLEFRLGTDISIFTDTEGAFTFANNVTGLSFTATDPTKTAYIKMTSDDEFWMRNSVAAESIIFSQETTDDNDVRLTWREDPSNTNASQLQLGIGAGGGKFNMGGAVIIWADKDGTETVFNEDSFDINFRIESATNAFAFFLDGGGEAVQFFGGTTANFDNTNSEITLGDVVTVNYGTEKRLEIGADHYFPTRNSSNPNGFWNEANQDMDFTFEGASDASLLKVDAGLNAVGMGGAAESGYKLKVHGKVNLTSGNTYNINGSPHTHYQKGTEVITCPSGSANTTHTITFPTAFASAPLVFFTAGPSGNFTAAEMPLIVRGSTLSTTQVSVFIRTVDGGTWAANRTLNLQWIAMEP